MTLDGNPVNVMSSKTWAFWIFSVGFVLSQNGGESEDSRFERYLAEHLLKDHMFEIRDFPCSNDEDKTGYIRLSIINTLCSSLTVNAGNNHGDCQETVINGSKKIVEILLGLKYIDNIVETCKKYACSYPNYTRYVDLNELRSMYNTAISWNGSVPDCPSPQNTSSQTQPSPTTSTPAATFSIDESPTSTPAPTYPPPQSTQSPKTSHQYTRASSSLRPSNTTVLPKTNVTAEKVCESEKTKNHIFSLLFSVSATLNVLLIIIVLWQCSKNQRDSFEAYQSHHNIELVYMQKGEQHFSARNQIPEVLHLKNKDQSLDDSGSLSSSSV